MTVLKDFHGQFNKRDFKLHLASDHPSAGGFISDLGGRRVQIGSLKKSFTRIF